MLWAGGWGREKRKENQRGGMQRERVDKGTRGRSDPRGGVSRICRGRYRSGCRVYPWCEERVCSCTNEEHDAVGAR